MDSFQVPPVTVEEAYFPTRRWCKPDSRLVRDVYAKDAANPVFG
jgi:hypothetical protein